MGKIKSAVQVLRAPDVLVQIGRNVARTRVTGPLDYHFQNGRSDPFSRVDIKIVNARNLRCKMCGQWGENGWHLGREPQFVRELVPFDAYKRLIDDVAPLKPWISLWGGEPLLYPEILPLIANIKQKGLTLAVQTNGRSLEKGWSLNSDPLPGRFAELWAIPSQISQRAVEGHVSVPAWPIPLEVFPG
jgi:hypothetical protein